jgi:hypothetical protein
MKINQNIDKTALTSKGDTQSIVKREVFIAQGSSHTTTCIESPERSYYHPDYKPTIIYDKKPQISDYRK